MPAFLPDLPVMLAFTVAGIVLSLTPGPDMSLWLARTVSGGRRAGFAAMFGTCVGCCVHSLLAALGISVLIRASPMAFNTMKLVGALYLVFLAVQMIRHGTVLNVAQDKPPTRRAPLLMSAFVTGIMVNLANPKVVLFFITFLPGFVTSSDPHVTGKLLFLGLYFVAVNIALSSVLITVAERFMSALRTNPRVLRIIDWLFAGVFGVFAVTILRTQARG